MTTARFHACCLLPAASTGPVTDPIVLPYVPTATAGSQPRDVPVGPVAFTLGKDAAWIQGLQEVVGSMKQGGKLR
jgi:hypothetical protein